MASFITIICATMPPLALMMILPLVAIPYILRAKHNRYTWLAVLGMILMTIAITLGANAISVVAKEGSGSSQSYTSTSFFEGSLMDTVTGIRFIGFMLAASGLAMCLPWYRIYQKWAYENLIVMDKANIAIAYFVVSGLSCSLFWFV